MSGETSKPNGTDPAQRLPSFKPPRDLSLGGVKPKKVFVPNLNVSRNKGKTQASSGVQESMKEERNRSRDRNNRPRPQRNGPNIIKSSGVFSEGLGATEKRASRPSFSREGGGDSTPQGIQRPVIRVKDVVKIDKELEEQKIKNVLGEVEGVEHESYDFKKARECDAPIKLPMDDGGYHRQTGVKVKQEVLVKEEPIDEDEANIINAIPEVKTETSDTPDIVHLLKSEETKLMLLQFPQSLPGQAGRTDDEPPRKKETNGPSTSTGEGEEDEPKPVDSSCCLVDLEEGKIGKLRVYHSGRVTLKLGDTEFDVSMGTQAAFHQEVVSVSHDDKSRSANIISLGPLTHKLNIVPDWEKMFKKMNV